MISCKGLSNSFHSLCRVVFVGVFFLDLFFLDVRRSVISFSWVGILSLVLHIWRRFSASDKKKILHIGNFEDDFSSAIHFGYVFNKCFAATMSLCACSTEGFTTKTITVTYSLTVIVASAVLNRGFQYTSLGTNRNIITFFCLTEFLFLLTKTRKIIQNKLLFQIHHHHHGSTISLLWL